MADDDIASASVRIDPDLSDFREMLKAKLDEATTGDDNDVTVKAKLDDDEFDAQVAKDKLQLDELAAKDAKPRVDLDTANSDESADTLRGKVQELTSSLFGLGGAAGDGGGGAGGGAGESAGEGLGIMGVGIAALLPLVGPLAGAATGVTLAFAGMATAAAAGIGGFAIAAYPIYKQVSTAMQTIAADQQAINNATSATAKDTAIVKLQQDLEGLNPMVRNLVGEIQGVEHEFDNWDKQFQGGVLQVFATALTAVKPLLADLTPLVQGGIMAVDGAVNTIVQDLSSPDLKEFFAWLGQQAPPALSTLIQLFMSFGGGISKMFEMLTPVIQMLESGLEHLGKRFEDFSTSKTFQSFVVWLQTNLPVVGKFLEDLIGVAAKFFIVLAPIGENLMQLFSYVVLPGIEVVLNAVGWLTEKAAPLVTQWSGAIARLSQDFKNWGKDVGTAVAEAWDYFERLGRDFDQWWNDIDQNVIHPFEIAFKVAATVFDAVFVDPLRIGIGLVWGTFETAWSILSTIFNGLVTFFTLTLPNAVTTVVNWFIKLPGDITRAVGDGYHLLLKWGDDIIHGVSDAVSTTWASVKTWFGGIPGDITSAVGSGLNVLEHFGEDIIHGIENGITSAASGLLGTVEGALRSALGPLGGLLSNIPGLGFLSGSGPTPAQAASTAAGQVAAASVALGTAGAGALSQTGTVPKAAAGGLVSGPTLLVAGEAGPELIVPMSELGGAGAPGTGNGISPLGGFGTASPGVNVVYQPQLQVIGNPDDETVAQMQKMLDDNNATLVSLIGSHS